MIVVENSPTISSIHRIGLYANLNSLVLDYIAKQKVGGVNLNFFFVKQFPILPPSAYTTADLDFIVPRVLELTYTAWDLKPFAEDLGYDGPPFRWDEDRRAVLRAELDAYYASLYGLTRDELRYILDPSDVYGPDFPGETFRVLKNNEMKRFSEFRTQRLVLEAWDRLGLAPRNRDGRYEVEAPAVAAPTSVPAAIAPPAAKPATANGATAQTGPSSARGEAAAPAASPRTSEADKRPSAPPAAPVQQKAAPAPAKPARRAASAPPQSQSQTLPLFATADDDLRQTVLRRALEVLAADTAPLTGRDIAKRLAETDSRIDRHFVNSVLAHEGARAVIRDPETGQYRLRPAEGTR